MKGIIGRKVGMTQIFGEDGKVFPVTVVEAGPCVVVQKKTKDKDGYEAIQLGYHAGKESKFNKPYLGHFMKHGVKPHLFLREFKVEDSGHFESGQMITVDLFQQGDRVRVTVNSKGKGFTGVIKRHGFHGAKSSHGVHEYFRHGGSIGSAATPSRVFKGKKMPGHHGAKRVTIKNVQVLDVRPDENLLLLKGSVPGAKRGILIISSEGPEGSTKSEG